ncbi:MAG: leucine-rich repeat domain-containing protein [Woronichinia naegeliana WA131]|uniref:non-specific serine/threonine protein kinase n=1 Tax=Woronichinia naegeliana WA131 TaxID=2824559 RepID=A0A977KWN7_9CYAN|nr:MAG: leucine-rich repeat domain-containing protein [Woronichinia naegeliana WA131]
MASDEVLRRIEEAARSNSKELNLAAQGLTEIPREVFQLQNLTTLSLYNNQIVEIPDAITQLQNLIRLNFSNNQIVEISDAIAQLQRLKVLYLHNNQIVKIPDVIFQLQRLKVLYLHNNQIVEIPNVIFQLQCLKVLYLSRNQIVEIPDAIAQLQNLTSLYLFRNQIVEIPDAIAQLQNLTILNLHNNQIVEIPDAIAQLQNLTRLDLSRNQIVEIPDEIQKLTKLKKLDLRRNYLSIPPEILGPLRLDKDPAPVAEILNYLRQLRQNTVRPLHEAKVLLVGQGSVGKTSLKKQLIHNQFDQNESKTDGLEVEYWPIKINENKIRLNVWDFGGQEIYHATHQFFLTKRSLYLLVCNCRISEEENRLEYWLKLIETFGDQSPVIIVGNKKDEQPFDINRKALLEKYPNIKAILETSCLSGQGIAKLRNAITQEIEQLKDVYNPLPLPWFEVKEQLETMTEDFISDRKYIRICIENNITEDENQEQLIDLLHRLGLVLCFRNHALLQSTNVLKPDWVTTGIYALLSDEILKTQKKGIFGASELIRILDNQRYPEKRHHYLIELMKEFQLCFKLNESEQYLIPGLLPKEEPENTDLGQDCLEFQYHYRVLPESIISRFIVLNHEKIYERTYWRSGVILFHQEASEICNLACIKADFEDKKIFISINGREQTRRLFLALIRDTFQKIHHTFTNFEVSEWVPVPDYSEIVLDYQNLLALEAREKKEYSIGRPPIDLNISQLLNGYETLESRKIQVGYIVNQTIYNQYGQGDNMSGDKVGQDKIGRDKIR